MPAIARFSRPNLVTIRPECVEIGGDLVVGALLSQIAFWYVPDKFGKSKLRVSRAGLYWIAKTRAEWMAETGLTLDQYRRAIAVLKAKGLVEVRPMKFHGDTMSHLRLRTELFAELCKEALSPMRDNPSSRQRDNPSSFSTESTYKDHHHTYTHPNGCDGENPSERDGEGSDMNAKEILARHQAQRQARPMTSSVPAMWVKRVETIYGKRKALTFKEVSQLKALKKRLGPQTMEVVIYALDHWEKFANLAYARAGLVRYPTEPVPGFLLQYYPAAVDLLWPPPTVPELVKAPTLMVPSNTTEEEGTPVSQADLDAMLADLLKKT